MTTTAEGIETPEQLRRVNALGYSEAQGYLISRPLPLDAVHRLLKLPDARFETISGDVRLAG